MCQGDPTLYTQDHSHDPGHPDPSQALPVSAAEDFIYKAIDELSPALRKLSLDIWENPQLAWEETHASKAASDFIGAYGFKVSLPAYDIPTAFEAVFEHKADGQGAVCVGFNSEYDALPEIGHACGHNLICIAGIACAIATAQALVKFNIPGKIVLLGTPAEEKDGGKVALIDKGAYKQMDVCLMLHPAPVSALCKMLAVSEVNCEFFGKSAHAAGAPWLGVNALDAAVSAYTSISLLRQQSEPTTRMHGIIKTRENAAANVIPAWAALRYGFRTTEVGTLEVLRERIENLFHAAANATGCTVKIDWLFTYFDLRINTKLGDAYTKYMLHQGIKLPKSIPQAGSTDFGNVSYELPGLHPVYAIPTTGINHTPEFTTASKTPEAHAATLKASKGLAATAWKAITDAVFLAEVKEDFENDKKPLLVEFDTDRGYWRKTTMWLCGILPSKASKYDSERLPPYTPGPKVESTAEKQPSIKSPTCLSAAEEFLNKAIDDLSGELRELSLKIWEHPQLAWHETYASKEASHFMEKHGFRISLPAYDLPTAFEAIFEHKADTKGAVCVGFNSEYDALPEIGQACGHNLICIGGIAPAIACAKALVEFDIPGKVVLLGTPAEEKEGGKIDLLKRGAYKQMDICLMLHPSPVAGLCKMLAVSEVKCEFFGKGAHAAGAPWLGINALDAAISAYNSISMLRQQTEPTARMHGLVRTKEGAATNIIPDWAQLDFGVRTVELGDLEALKKKMERILEAAASSTGCTLKYSWEYTYFDVRHNPKLGEAYTKFMKDSQGIQLPDPINFGSTDFGNVSYELPALHPIYAIATEGVNHTPEFTAAAKTMEAHIETLKSSKGLAATAWKAVTDATFLKEVKQAFEDDKKQNCLGTVEGNRKRGLWRR